MHDTLDLCIVHNQFIVMPLSLKSHFLDTMTAYAGAPPDLAPVPATALPLFLREQYTLCSAHLFGRTLLLAFEQERDAPRTPGEYRAQAEQLQNILGEQVVLVLSALPSYARNRMVQLGVAFSVPGSQTFIPFGVVDLRERFSAPDAEARETLSPAAQCTVLCQLLHRNLAGLSLKDIAHKLHYSPMRLTTAAKELERASVCTLKRIGRATTLEFPATGRHLWDQVKPRLASPVTQTLWVHWNQPPREALLAGLSALSRLTLLADDRLPTHAMSGAAYREAVAQDTLRECPEPDVASARLELWRYSPGKLTDPNLGAVDPLSLLLSLRASPDERIQQQVALVEEQHPW